MAVPAVASRQGLGALGALGYYTWLKRSAHPSPSGASTKGAIVTEPATLVPSAGTTLVRPAAARRCYVRIIMVEIKENTINLEMRKTIQRFINLFMGLGHSYFCIKIYRFGTPMAFKM